MRARENGAGASTPAPKTITAPSGRSKLYANQPFRRQPVELLDREPPKDVDAERAVLAVALLVPGRFPEVAALLCPADFSDEANRKIFSAMLRLQVAAKPIDITLLVGALRDAGEYNADDGVTATRLASLFQLYPSACNLRYYAARLMEMSHRRHALERGIALIQAAHSGDHGPTLPPSAIRRATQLALEHRARKGGQL